MKNILVPTDFSTCAYYACKVAAEIAKKSGATLHFLHVIDIPILSSDMGINAYENVPETLFLMNHAKENMQKLTEDSLFNGINTTSSIDYDSTYSRITQKVKEDNIDLIVMGSHGASGFQEFIVGSNAERVTRFADCPVLTIKNDHDSFDLKNIVLASNFHGEADVMFNKFVEFADLFEAHIHLLKVNTASEFETTRYSRKIMEDFAKSHQLKNYSLHVYNDENEEEGILHYSQEVGADLIAIGTHGRTGLAQLINGSLAEDVLNHAARPVLSIKIKHPKIRYGVLFPETK